MQRIQRRLALGTREDAGFTLIELLVVIIIIAILAAIAIPTYMGQRTHAADSAAFSLVRNALTAVQTAFVDTADYSEITAAMLNDIETSITFIQGGGSMVTTDPPSIDDSVVAEASEDEVIFFAENRNVFDIASMSASGSWFGIQIDALNLDETGYVKVSVIDGEPELGW